MSSPRKPISKMLVKELRAELERRNMDTSGLKAVLQARLEEVVTKEEEGTNEVTETSETKQEETKEVKSPEKPATTPIGKNATPKKATPQKQPIPEEKTPEKTTPKKAEPIKESMDIQKEEDKKRKVPEEKASPAKNIKTDSPSAKRSKTTVPDVSSNTMKEILPTLGQKPNAGKAVEKPNSVETAKTTKSPEVEKQTSNGDMEVEEKREVPPSTKTPTSVLFITHFVRPFTKPAVEKLLKETGTVQKWDMDLIKSRCFVKYETVEQANATREALHNLIWPPTNKTRLQVDFGEESDAESFLNQGKPSLTAKPVGPNRNLPNPAKVDQPVEKVKTLDDFFSKTETLPHLYWKPLDEEEMKERDNASSVSTERR